MDEREGELTSLRLSRLGYEAGTRILSLLLLRNTQTSGMKVRRVFRRHASLEAKS